MSFPLQRYNLDPTGRSPNNYVSAEEHTLSARHGPYHPLAPLYGPFYNDVETFSVYKNNIRLEYGVDYWSTNLIQDGTAKFSYEVCEVVILKGCLEGDVITLNYQCLGGLYQNHAKGLVNLYNAYIADNRPVDWTKGIVNKPSEYPPSYHLHMLQDVVNWESIIVAIERLINALTLKNVPAFEALIDWVIARTMETVTEQEIEAASPVDKIVTMRRLLYSTKILNYNGVTIKPKETRKRQGEFFILEIKSTNFPNNTKLFWEIEHIGSFPGMFKNESGIVEINDQEGFFYLNTVKQPKTSGEFDFRIRLKRESKNGLLLSTSKPLTLVYTPTWDTDYGLMQNGLWSVPTTQMSHVVWKTPESMFLIPDDNYYKVYYE